jgi:glycosyltransferase involved in cell wall biosynthesis
MSKNPKVTVLIFAYNHEEYIEEAINSVVCQKCTFNFDILVTDDASTDDTLGIINRLQSEQPNLIKVISNEYNIGLNTTFSNAVKNARGDYLALLGGDDYWIVEDKLEMQVQLLLSNSEIAYVHTEYKSLNEFDQEITNHLNKKWDSILTKKTGGESLVNMLSHNWTNYPLGSSSCFRKYPLLKGINLHPEILNFNMMGEGTIVHASMTFYGGRYAFIPIQTTIYRIRKKSLSHYENKVDSFNYQKKYFFLRLLTANSFGLNQNEIKKIKKRGLFELMDIAIELDVINEFKLFLETQYLLKSKLLFFGILISVFKIKNIRRVYRLMLKYLKFIKIGK